VTALPLPEHAIEYTGAPEGFPEWLRARAVYLEAWEGETATVRTLRRIARELDAAFRRGAARPVGLTEAARIGGYSISHLGRILREQPDRNVGTKHRPAFAYSDVPCKTRDHRPREEDSGMAAAVPSRHTEPAVQTGGSRAETERGRPKAGGAVGARLLSTKLALRGGNW
jgi:hypothetical protein